MRFVIQRVLSASVAVDNIVISSINRGVCVLVGIGQDDTMKDAQRLISKLLGMRLWADQDGKPWRRSIVNNGYEILFVSQFTLYARMKGTKPDYSHAMPPKEAEVLYNQFLDLARKKYESDKIFDGKFGAYMNVKIENDGPVTIHLNTDDSVAKQKKDPNSKRSQRKKQSKIENKADESNMSLQSVTSLGSFCGSPSLDDSEPVLQKLDKLIEML
eukprot:21460_1